MAIHNSYGFARALGSAKLGGYWRLEIGDSVVKTGHVNPKFVFRIFITKISLKGKKSILKSFSSLIAKSRSQKALNLVHC